MTDPRTSLMTAAGRQGRQVAKCERAHRTGDSPQKRAERRSSTPVEETMAAPHDVVKAGKARYIGASSMDAPVVGTPKERHLADAVAALDLKLTDDEITALEEPYALRQPTWF